MAMPTDAVLFPGHPPHHVAPGAGNHQKPVFFAPGGGQSRIGVLANHNFFCPRPDRLQDPPRQGHFHRTTCPGQARPDGHGGLWQTGADLPEKFSQPLTPHLQDVARTFRALRQPASPCIQQNPPGLGSPRLDPQDRAGFFHVALLHATPKMPSR